jgi:hypothetical protein
MRPVSDLIPLNISVSFHFTNIWNSVKNITVIKSLFFMATGVPEFS